MRNNSEEYHKTHPSLLTDNLYLAAARSLSAKVMLELGITSIINATLELPTMAYQKQDAIQIAVEDRVASKLYLYFDLAADKIQQVHLTGGKILVYCRAGVSRSASLCIAYFMKYHGLAFEEAFQYVKARRPIIHPNIGFVRQLKDFEQKIRSKKSIPAIPPQLPLTPSVRRRAAVPACISFAEEDKAEEPAYHEPEEELVPIKRPKSRRPKVVVHELSSGVAVQFQVVPAVAAKEAAASGGGGAKLAGGGETATGCLQEPLTVATINTDTGVDTASTLDHSARRAKRKTAFTKLTKPNEPAVSFINLPFDFVCDSSSRKAFKLQMQTENPVSVVSELLQLCQVTEEVPAERVGEVAAAVAAGAARCAARLHGPLAAATSSIVQPLLCCTPVHGNDSHVKKFKEKSIVRSRSSIKTALRGHHTSGQKVKNSSQPAKASVTTGTTCHATVSVCPSVFVVATTSAPVICWQGEPDDRQDSVAQPASKSRYTPLKRPGQLRSPAKAAQAKNLSEPPKAGLCTAKSVVQACHGLDVRPAGAWALTAEKGTAASLRCCRLAVSILPHQAVAGQAAGCLATTVPLECRYERAKKEFPYYSKFKDAGKQQGFRLEGPATATRPDVRYTGGKTGGPGSQSAKLPRRKKTDTQWSIERCLRDQPIVELAKPLKSNIITYRATAVPIEAVSYTQFQPMVYYKVNLVGRFYVPQNNPVLLKKESDQPWLPVVQTLEPHLLELVKPYTTPLNLLHLVHAKRSLQPVGFGAATTYVHDVKESSEASEDIPDEIFDINEFKHLLSEEKDLPKCQIWFEVFKRTMIRQQPTYAELSLVGCSLSCAGQHREELLECAASLLPSSSCHEVARRCPELPRHAVNTTHATRVFEGFQEFDRIEKRQVQTLTQSYSRKLVANSNYTCCDAPVCLEEAPTFAQAPKVCAEFAPQRCASSVAFPNRIPTLSREAVFATAEPFACPPAHRRHPFRKVCGLRPAAQAAGQTGLECAGSLPTYQFVQDIEDQADVGLHASQLADAPEGRLAETLWFFALTTDTEEQQQLQQEEDPESSILIFLPDPETASRLGKEDVEEAGAACDLDMTEVRTVVEEEIAMKMRPRQERPTRRDDKRVKFADPTSTTTTTPAEKESPKSGSNRPRVRTIYYGRDRSKSRSRLSDLKNEAAGRGRERSGSRPKLSEAEVMSSLSSSVRTANDILGRRRARAQETFARREEERWRPAEEAAESAAATAAGGGLLGIINVAQGWLSGRSSRRDQQAYPRRHKHY